MAWTVVSSGQDRQDFVDAESVSSALLAFTSASSPSGATTGVMDVRRWPFLQIFGQMGDGGGVAMSLFVSWYADVGGTLTMGKTLYNTLLSADIVDVIPNQGPYCVVIVNFSDAAAHNSTVRLMGRTTSGLGGAGEYTGGECGEVLAQIGFQAIANGGFLSAVSRYVQRGKGALFIDTDGGPGVRAVVNCLGAAGTYGAAFAGVSTVAIQGRNTVIVPLPSSLTQLFIFNNSGAACNCGVSLYMLYDSD